ncbi:hypothetical protein K445DRAFT_18879 [Daldinia sp. EC12]|nr:hypothetical protein K445DRAFT_18879 [Daldinia sp. EC12]
MEGMPMPSSMGSSASSTTSTAHSTFNSLVPTPAASSGVSYNMDNMEGMGDRETQEGGCKISMLWNWDTIDTCFLSDSWQVKSPGGFAALCIGVVLLVILLEALRRAARIYDRNLVRQHVRTTNALTAVSVDNSPDTANRALIVKEGAAALARTTPFRPKFWQQAIRALLHTLHFALAYWVMLLAMYYNGYIIISIVIGAYLGFFVLQWERIGPRSDDEGGFDKEKEATGSHG